MLSEEVDWLRPGDLDLWTSALLVLASSFTSFLSAAIGLGGGLVLLAIMGSVMPIATMIPVHGVVQLGSNAGRAVLLWRDVNVTILLPFLTGGSFGAAIGSAVIIRLPPEILQVGLGVFVLWSVWGTLPAAIKGRLAMAAVGLISTFLTMFFGATGVFVGAAIKPLKLEPASYVASHATCMTIQHGLKVIAFVILGFAFADYLPLIALMIASGLMGTLAGRYLLIRSGKAYFERLLSILLSLLAIRLFWQAIDSTFL